MKFSFGNRRRRHRPETPGRAGFREGLPSKKGKIFGFLFGIPFFAMGAAFCWFGAVRPIVDVVDSRSWPQVECRIVTSEVERKRGDDGDTFRVVTTFSYHFDGRDYTGGSYDFSEMSSSGYDGKAKIVQSLPVGAETVCWVNPDNPTIAVLNRDVPGIIYFILPFTSIFMLVGGAIMLGSLGLLPGKFSRAFQTKHKRVVQTDQGEVQLKPSLGPRGKLAAAVGAAAFWNGIVSVFVWQWLGDFQAGNTDWFLTIFLIPFVLIGLVLLGAIVYFALAVLNPRFHINLDEGSPRLGGTVRLRWRLAGATQRLKRMTLEIEGRETATYRVGTRSVTDESLFYREVLFETETVLNHRDGEVEISIPSNLMHSFSGGNNQIKWSLRAHGAIARWPDVNERYPLTVRPLKINPTQP